ncbi:MAG: DALR anticodon-binding domain-containing protein, partial [Mariprofundaceae bacterium]
NIQRRAAEAGLEEADPAVVEVSLLTHAEEQRLIAHLLAWPEVLQKAADALEPYRVATWALKLAADFHGFYHKHRVVTDDAALSQARLLLVRAVGQVIRNALGILGVRAPERM